MLHRELQVEESDTTCFGKTETKLKRGLQLLSKTLKNQNEQEPINSGVAGKGEDN